MTASTQPIPEGFHTVTAHLIVDGAADAIAFYKQAFGAEEMIRMPMPGNPSRLMHAQIRIGDSMVMLADTFAGCSQGPDGSGMTPVTIHLYVADADAVFATAIRAGAKEEMAVSETFWGDRYGQLTDPFGHRWSIATHVRDLTPEQMAKGAEEMFAAFAAQQS